MSSLGKYLIERGFDVDDHPVRGRDAAWQGVSWVMLHHYAGSENPADAPREAHYLRFGGIYPPNAHLYVDLTGKVWVICQEKPGQPVPGRSTHAGEGSYPGIPTNRANEVAVGTEVQCCGLHPLSTHKTMWPVVVRLQAALLDYFDLSTSRLIGHKEYAGTAQGKVDPVDDMKEVRRQVEACRNEEEEMPTADEVAKAVWDHAATVPDALGGKTRTMRSLQVWAATWAKTGALEGRQQAKALRAAITEVVLEDTGVSLSDDSLDRIETRMVEVLGEAVINVDIDVTGVE